MLSGTDQQSYEVCSDGKSCVLSTNFVLPTAGLGCGWPDVNLLHWQQQFCDRQPKPGGKPAEVPHRP